MMKKTIQLLLLLTTFFLLTNCTSKKDELQQINIGNISLKYDEDVWQYSKNTDESAPLEFTDSNGNLINIFVSQESTYQHPLEMIVFFETMASAYDEFDVFLEPTKVEVNGTNWYEYGYSYKDGDTTYKNYQRYYGKYYNAASISYISTEEKFETGYENALEMMSNIKVTDVTNDVNEAKAQKFLVGEWDLGINGYLVINNDATYNWYKDSSKDKNNMHYGTFGCDVENEKISLKEGDGIYLVLFPEGLIIDGVEEENTGYKSDYIISFDNNGSDAYQMVNMSTYNLYTIIKQ